MTSSFRMLSAPPPNDPKLSIAAQTFFREVYNVVNGIMRGKLNITGTVTLAPSATTTTITDMRIGGGTVVLLQPTTANAAAALATTYPSTSGAGSVVINHASNVQTDRTFKIVLIG
jgi:hypothetical protein